MDTCAMQHPSVACDGLTPEHCCGSYFNCKSIVVNAGTSTQPAALGPGVFTIPNRPTRRRRSGPRDAGGWWPGQSHSRASLGGWGALWMMGHHGRCGPFLLAFKSLHHWCRAAYRPVPRLPRAPRRPQRARMWWRCKPSAEVPTNRPSCQTNQEQQT